MGYGITRGGEGCHHLLERLADGAVVVRQAQHDGRRALGHVEDVAARVLERGGRALDRRVEGRVVELRGEMRARWEG